MSDTSAIRIANALEALDLDTAIETNPNMWGICDLVTDILDEHNESFVIANLVTDQLHHIWPLWPKYSGNKYYPIPCPSDVTVPSEFFTTNPEPEARRAQWAFTHLYRWSGEYGKLRREAFEWLINYLRAHPNRLTFDEYKKENNV